MVAGRSKALYEKAAKERQSKLNGKTQLPVNLPEAKGDARELGLYIQANFPECLNTKKTVTPKDDGSSVSSWFNPTSKTIQNSVESIPKLWDFYRIDFLRLTKTCRSIPSF
jgi:hypothetical protein